MSEKSYDPLNNSLLVSLLIFFVILFIYISCMTGFSFNFQELKLFPNYNMLAKAFVKGQLFIEETPLEDYLDVNGKRYLYFGPVPALIRTPLLILFKRGIPTGFMIAMFCAGIIACFYLFQKEIVAVDPKQSLLCVTFLTVTSFNGFAFFMNSLPSIHHEAICSAMFFLFAALYLVIRIRTHNYLPGIWTCILIGLFLACSIGSRVSYIFSAMFIVLIVCREIWQLPGPLDKKTKLLSLLTISTIVLVSIFLLFAYNWARFGNPLEFGIKYQVSIYQEYFAKGYFLRLEHIPYNLWSLFLKLPVLTQEFPFVVLPFYILKSEPIGSVNSFLLNANELSVSVFILMPILLLFFLPTFGPTIQKMSLPRNDYVILFVVFAFQVLSISLTMQTAARFYYDFLPILLLMSFIGAVQLRRPKKVFNLLVVTLAAISIILSFSVPINGILFYSHEINYRFPISNLLGLDQ